MTYYVRIRPGLAKFLAKVTELFEVGVRAGLRARHAVSGVSVLRWTEVCSMSPAQNRGSGIGQALIMDEANFPGYP